MTRIVFSILLLSCTVLFTSSAFGANSYIVGEPVEGKVYNKLLKRWSTKQFVLMAIIDQKTKAKILMAGADTGVGPARVLVAYTPEVKKGLEIGVSKAIKWSKVAKKNKADADKGIGCYGEPTKSCRSAGAAHRENQLGLRFFSSNAGKQTDLILSVIDTSNQFIKAELYLDPSAMKTLLQNVKMIDQTFAKAQIQAKKHDLFN